VNSSFQLEAIEKLVPAGFKKQREYFFLIREPHVMVLYRKFMPDRKEEFYLCFTHTFFSQVSGKSGKYLIPNLLEQYPVSIEVAQLRSQFLKYQTIQEFDCDLHHLTRELSPSASATLKPSFWKKLFNKIFAMKASSSAIADPVEVALNEGLQFLSQFSPAFSQQVLLKTPAMENSIIPEQLAACAQYLKVSNTK
jgi:hypothetical protein